MRRTGREKKKKPQDFCHRGHSAASGRNQKRSAQGQGARQVGACVFRLFGNQQGCWQPAMR